METLKFESEILKEEDVGKYHLKMVDDDPYFYVTVTRDDIFFTSHLLSKESEFEDLKEFYSTKIE